MENFIVPLDLAFLMKWILAALVFILLDIVTGLIKAAKRHEFKSSVMREGLFHKCGLILAILLFVAIDAVQSYVGVEDVLASMLGVENIALKPSVTPAICVYISLMEIGSILENLCIINPQLMPAKIIKLLGLEKEVAKLKELTAAPEGEDNERN